MADFPLAIPLDPRTERFVRWLIRSSCPEMWRDDLYQDVLVELLGRPREALSGTMLKFLVWSKASKYNSRRAATRLETSLDDRLESKPWTEPGSAAYFDEWVPAMLALRDAWAALTTRQRLVIGARFVQEIEAGEIGKRLGIGAGMVYLIVKQGREILRASLEGQTANHARAQRTSLREETAEMNARILALHHEGLEPAEISAIVGRSKRTVQEAIQRDRAAQGIKLGRGRPRKVSA